MSSLAQIVIVDDDHQVVQCLKKTLESNGYAVKATTSGRHAIAIVEEDRPDLLIMDLNMPSPDGFELLKAERSRFPGLRILVISGYMGGALLEAASILGATATLEKPVSAEALVETVRDVLGSSRHLDQIATIGVQ
jgi:DNA-binding NtrC family response regulator